MLAAILIIEVIILALIAWMLFDMGEKYDDLCMKISFNNSIMEINHKNLQSLMEINYKCLNTRLDQALEDHAKIIELFKQQVEIDENENKLMDLHNKGMNAGFSSIFNTINDRYSNLYEEYQDIRKKMQALYDLIRDVAKGDIPT